MDSFPVEIVEIERRMVALRLASYSNLSNKINKEISALFLRIEMKIIGNSSLFVFLDF